MFIIETSSAMEIGTLEHLKPIDMTGRLVRCIRQESENVVDNNDDSENTKTSKMYSDTLRRSSQEILPSICRGVELYGANAMGVGGDLGDSGAAQEQEPKLKTVVVGVHGGAGNRYGGCGFNLW